MILVIVVALWIVWVAPYLLRQGGPQLQPAHDFLADVIDREPFEHRTGTVMNMMAPQGKPAANTPPSAHAAAEVPAAEARTNERPVFKIKYGRLALALAGLLSLLTGVIAAALRLFGLDSGWLPLAALLGGVAATMVLRRLAVRDRRRKVSAAFRAAMGPAERADAAGQERQPAAHRPQAPHAAHDRPLFDAEADAAAQPAAPRPLTAAELREAAMAEAIASGDVVLPAPPVPAGDSSWEPVEVPKPSYVEAPKAERAAPEPLDLPEAPKAVGKPSLKQDLARPAAGQQPAPGADPETRVMGRGQSALSNLDDVLQRRRA